MKVIKIGATESGGERAFLKELESWVTPHHINGLALIAPNHPVFADAVILTPSGPVLVEVKTLGEDVAGQLSVPVNDEWCGEDGPLDLRLTGKDINPIGQTQTYTKKLRNYLQEHTELDTTWVDGLVVLVQPVRNNRVNIEGTPGIMRYPTHSLGIEVTTLTRFGGNGHLRTYFHRRATSSKPYSIADARAFLQAMGLSQTSSRFPSDEELKQEGFATDVAADNAGSPARGLREAETPSFPAEPEAETGDHADLSQVGPSAGASDDAGMAADLTASETGDATRPVSTAHAHRAPSWEGTAQVTGTGERSPSGDETPSAPWAASAEAGPTDPTRIVPTQAGADETRSVATHGASGVEREDTRSVPTGSTAATWPQDPPTPPPSYTAHQVPARNPSAASRFATGTTRAVKAAARARQQHPSRSHEPSVTAPIPVGSTVRKQRRGAGRVVRTVGILLGLWLVIGTLGWSVAKLGSRGGGDAATLISTKSNNIVCRMTTDETRCDIDTVKYGMSSVPSKCGSSPNWGHTFVIGQGAKVRLECPDERMRVADQSTQQLDWGETKTVGATTCVSKPDALTCTSGTHGFRLRKAKYDVW